MKRFVSLATVFALVFSLIPMITISYSQASEVEYNIGDTILFGNYPQSLVTDNELIVKLNAEEKEWQSYGYYHTEYKDYVREGGAMRADDYMQYADLFYEGRKYRAVTFSKYRPRDTTEWCSVLNSFQEVNGYSENAIYYFLFENLSWRILDPSTNLIICELIIDSQAYTNFAQYIPFEYKNMSGKPTSDYFSSSIRDWLLNDFLDTAFTLTQKEKIQKSLIGKNDSDPIYDSVFLLSASEASNDLYGLSDKSGMAKSTDYAKCQGLYVQTADGRWDDPALKGYSRYWKRMDASSGISGFLTTTSEGVRPACRLKELQSDDTYPSNSFEQFTLSFDANGGSDAPDSQTKEKRIPLTISDSIPSKAYSVFFDANGGKLSISTKSVKCIFNNWNLSKNGDGKTYAPGDSYIDDSNATLYAQWVNPKLGKLEILEREGFSFDGWYTAKDGGDLVSENTEITSDVMLYAHWTEVPYNVFSVTFHCDGGTNLPEPQEKIEDEPLVLSTTIPVIEYQVTFDPNGGTVSSPSIAVKSRFVEWNTNKDGTGKAYHPGDEYLDNADLTLYAQWEHQTIGTLPVPVREGYNFAGWFTEKNGGKRISATELIEKDISVYAQWKEVGSVSINVDESKPIDKDLLPVFSADDISWKSEQQKIVSVSEDGTITGLAKGNAIITATTQSGESAQIKVQVVQKAKEVKLNKTEVSVTALGETVQLEATVFPEDADETKVIWSSSDPSVAEVDENGKVTVLKDGDAEITASVAGTYVSSVCRISVVSVMPGDVDLDGEVTSGDARIALRRSVGLEKFEKGSKQYLAADVDGDGSVSSADARLILRASVGLETLQQTSHYHVYGKETRVEPSCEEEGYLSSRCRICGEEKRVPIPALGHNWISKNGVKGKVCSVCGKKECEFHGHSFVEKTLVAATCTKVGVKTLTCSICGVEYSEEIPVADHKWKVATCTTAKKCSVCGLTEGEPLGHKWNDGKVTKQATCTEKGVKTFTCTVCKTTKTESIPLVAHKLTKVARVEPTTEKAGNIAHYHCSVCGGNFSDSKGKSPVASVVIPKLEKPKELSSSEVFKAAKQYTVEINVTGKDFSGTGTGFFISNDGSIVTNYHVINRATTIKVTDCNNKTYTVSKILAYDKNMDLAVLKISASSTAAVLNKTDYETGDKVYTLGSSKGLTYTFSDGLIATRSRKVEDYNPDMYYIQTSAPISAGNSGGPLIDEYGRVIGVNTWSRTDGQNLNFAVPVSYLDQLDYSNPLTLKEFIAATAVTGTITPKTKSLTLRKGACAFIPITITATDEYTIWYNEKSAGIRCEWTTWEDDNIAMLIVYADDICSSVPINLYFEDNPNVKNTISVTVSKTSGATSYYSVSSIPDFGVMTGVSPYEAVYYYDDTVMSYFSYDSTELSALGYKTTQSCRTPYFKLLENKGFKYDSYTKENGFAIWYYINPTLKLKVSYSEIYGDNGSCDIVDIGYWFY